MLLPHPDWHPSSPVWNPIPFLEPHPHVWNSIPMSGTPFLVWNAIPMSGTPSLVWNSHVWNLISMSGTPSTCLELHPWSGTPSLVILAKFPPPHPSAPPHHLASVLLPHLLLPTPVWPLTALTHLVWPQASPPPSGTPTPYLPLSQSSCPHPQTIKYHHQRSPPPEKEIWVFLSFPSFPMFVSISPHVIISFTSRGKIPIIVVQQHRFHQ